MEINEDPKPRATNGSISSLPVLSNPKYSIIKYPAIPAKARPTTNNPVTAPALRKQHKDLF